MSSGFGLCAGSCGHYGLTEAAGEPDTGSEGLFQLCHKGTTGRAEKDREQP